MKGKMKILFPTLYTLFFGIGLVFPVLGDIAMLATFPTIVFVPIIDTFVTRDKDLSNLFIALAIFFWFVIGWLFDLFIAKIRAWRVDLRNWESRRRSK